MTHWVEQVQWNNDGLAPVITQDYKTKQVLTLAWMNREALRLTAESGHAVYWSRSRQKIWHKGEQSGHQQQIKGIQLDCDNDAILLQVEQIGGIACHTGRQHCFFQRLHNGEWQISEPVMKEPSEIYK